MDAPHAGGLGGTYGGNPIATAAALGALRAYDEHDLLARARELEGIIRDELTALQSRDARIGDFRGRGAMMAIELVDADGRPDAALTGRVAKHCHAQGVESHRGFVGQGQHELVHVHPQRRGNARQPHRLVVRLGQPQAQEVGRRGHRLHAAHRAARGSLQIPG